MRENEENLVDSCNGPLTDDLDLSVNDFIADQEKTSTQKQGVHMNVRRRLEQLREERELAYHLQSDFDL